jgi:DNA-binding beta-propeller fold protein YncE
MLTSKSHPDRWLVVAIRQIALCLTVMMLCCSCGSGRGKLFEQLNQPVFWPAPPEQPRIKYLGQLSTEEDLKREVSSMAALGRFIFGRENIGVLTSPRGLALDNQERLFVADSSGAVVHMMNLATRKYRQFSKLAGEEKLLSPIDLTVVDNDIYVSDSVLKKICVFNQKGEYKFSFGSGILQRPSGIVYSYTQKQLYVVDTKRHVVDVFDKQGHHLNEFGSRGTGRGQFNFPTYLWIDKEGKLYVSDTLNYRIQVLTPDGKVLMVLGRHGNRPGYFAHPCGVATDSFGNIYVSDKQFENIQVFNSRGQILMAFGSEGHGPGQFWLPTGIFIDDNNRIFVADSFNKRIQVFQLLEGQIP